MCNINWMLSQIWTIANEFLLTGNLLLFHLLLWIQTSEKCLRIPTRAQLSLSYTVQCQWENGTLNMLNIAQPERLNNVQNGFYNKQIKSSFWSFIHSFIHYLLNIFYVPSTVLSVGNTEARDNNPSSLYPYRSSRKDRLKPNNHTTEINVVRGRTDTGNSGETAWRKWGLSWAGSLVKAWLNATNGY